MAQKIGNKKSSWDSEDEKNNKVRTSWDSNSDDENKNKYDDWDSDSDCKETMVVPFNKELLSDEPWDSESKDLNDKKYVIIKAEEKPVEIESDSLSIKDIESLKSEKNENLYIEDIEEIVLDDKNSQDNTVWMIPSSARTKCSDTLESELSELKLVDDSVFNINKSKSYPDFEHFKEVKRSKSKSLDQFQDELNIEPTLNIYEGSNIEKLDKEEKGKDNSLLKELTSPQGNYFREYETRMVLPEELKEEEPCVEVLPYLTDEPSTSHDSSSPSNRSSESSKSRSFSLSLRKVGKKHAARKSLHCKYQEKPGNKTGKKSKSHKIKPDCKIKERPVTESWIFLDESGQSQQVTKNEVNILLNGRSADAVLQEQKENLLSNESIGRNASTELLSTPILEKNVRDLISKEDVTDEAHGKSIGLERKVGNMLLYIRSRVDLEASVRFISVDTDMINMWRRSKDYIESSHIANDPEKSENQIGLQNIILQHSKTIESLAEDLKKFQNSLEEERRRNLELEKEIHHLRAMNAKSSNGNSDRTSNHNSSEPDPFEYSTVDACLSPIEEAQNKVEDAFQVREPLPNFIGIGQDTLNENIFDGRRNCETVNLFSTKNGESENSSNADEAQAYHEKKSSKSETNPFILESNFDGLTRPNRPESRSNPSSHYEEDSETESLQTNLEQKGKNESSVIKDLLYDIEEAIKKLRDNGLDLDTEVNQEDDADFIRFYIKELTEKFIKIQTENAISVINPDDYYQTISEKTALSQEVKNVKAENALLLESQVEQFEKLKQTMHALNDQKTQNTKLENIKASLKSENEELLKKIKNNEKERKNLENRLAELRELFDAERSKLKKLEEGIIKKDEEIKKANEKLKKICGKFENFEEQQRTKDEAINKLKCDNKELTSKDSLNLCAIEFLTERMKNIEADKLNLESELTSVKISSEESLNYIANLERIVHDTQENLEKIKKKLSDSNKSLSDLKKENQILNEKNESNFAFCQKLKAKSEEYKEKIKMLMHESEEKEKEREKITNNFKQENEGLKIFVENLKLENKNLKIKITNSKDQFLKERKDFLNEIELASKKMFKLDQKYRNLKLECNERASLIGHLEILLRKSVAEYNEKIVKLEKSMSDILEKIEVYKKRVREKNVGDEFKFAELENQLQVTDQEKWSLERDVADYYKVVKILKAELEEKQKSLEETNLRLVKNEWKEKIEIKQDVNFGTQTEREKEEKDIISQDKLVDELQENYKKEKKELEKLIVGLKSENEKLEAKNQVMMTNLSHCGKNLSDFSVKQRIYEENEKKKSQLKLEIKNLISKLVSKSKDLKKIEDELQAYVVKVEQLSEKLKQSHSTISELQTQLSEEKSNSEFLQRERNEMTDKLLQSVKLIMDERASKQSVLLLSSEKEKLFKDELEDKKMLLTSLQDEMSRLKTENSKKVSVGSPFQQSQKMKNVMVQVKNLRALNLQLRKKEGGLQGKILLLEEELRNARLSMKQVEGELMNERKFKKNCKAMVDAVEEEIKKLQLEKVISFSAAEKIRRHFNLLTVNL